MRALLGRSPSPVAAPRAAGPRRQATRATALAPPPGPQRGGVRSPSVSPRPRSRTPRWTRDSPDTDSSSGSSSPARATAPSPHDSLASAFYRETGPDLPCVSVTPATVRIDSAWGHHDWGEVGDAAFKAAAAAALRTPNAAPSQRSVDNHATHFASLVQDHLRREHARYEPAWTVAQRCCSVPASSSFHDYVAALDLPTCVMLDPVLLAALATVAKRNLCIFTPSSSCQDRWVFTARASPDRPNQLAVLNADTRPPLTLGAGATRDGHMVELLVAAYLDPPPQGNDAAAVGGASETGDGAADAGRAPTGAGRHDTTDSPEGGRRGANHAPARRCDPCRRRVQRVRLSPPARGRGDDQTNPAPLQDPWETPRGTPPLLAWTPLAEAAMQAR